MSDAIAMVCMLQQDGAEIEFCDTPVPYYSNGISCGSLNDMGDYDGEMIMIPRRLAGWDGCVVLRTVGDSMIGANIEEGDRVVVNMLQEPQEGDVVAAREGNEFTLKGFHRDSNGVNWLVPMNDAYRPICLKYHREIHILGRVTDISKRLGRLSYCQIEQQMKKAEVVEEQAISDEDVCDAIMEVLPMLTVKRHWYSIYRALVDVDYLRRGDYDGFKSKMDEWFPNCEYQVDVKDLSRMAVFSFDKRVSFWDEKSAPVTGRRFQEYKNIATRLLELLRQ